MVEKLISRLHSDLRKAKPGKWAVFLGAGASYDYGIPTMKEMATRLVAMAKSNELDHGISEETIALIKILLVTTKEDEILWNIEELISRLHQLYQVASGGNLPFVSATASIDKKSLDANEIGKASEELLGYMAKMCELSARKHASHGEGSIEYLADFITYFSEFGNMLSIFTINIDLCIEAAIVRLSQRARRSRKPEFPFVDGFDTGIVPTFEIRNYRRDLVPRDEFRPVYYWKLHGSVDWTFSSPFDENAARKQLEETNEEQGFSDDSIIMRRGDKERWTELYDCCAISSPLAAAEGRIAIFPTPEKYLQTYTFPYMDLFEAFRRTLEEIELLIVVGTSFSDQHILSAIRSFVQRDNVLLFVIDPFLNENDLVRKFGDVKAIQPVVRMGFKDFIKSFTELEASEGTGE